MKQFFIVNVGENSNKARIGRALVNEDINIGRILKMSGVSQLVDCPWHVENLRRKDERRHKSYCMHFSKGKFITSKSAYFELPCGGSVHCSTYFTSM